VNARHARRIRRGIDRARSDAAQGLPGLLVSTDELEQAAYRRTRARYARARFVGWKVPLPPVPPSKYRGLRWINPARRGRL
jgi:hypothetical protein